MDHASLVLASLSPGRGAKELAEYLRPIVRRRAAAAAEEEERQCVVCFRPLENHFAVFPCGHTRTCGECIATIMCGDRR